MVLCCVVWCEETLGLTALFIGNGKKLHAAFMDLENAYDRVEREALWSVLKIYRLRGHLLEGIKALYRGM